LPNAVEVNQMSTTTHAGLPAHPPESSSSQTDSAAGPPWSEFQRLGFVALVAFALFSCMTGLNGGLAMGDHECINALTARQALQTGEWLIPRLGETPRIRKPPLGIWLIMASSRLFDNATASLPVTEFTARLPSALAGFGAAMVLFWLGRMMYGYTGGLVAGFIWASSAAAIFYSRNAQVDMVLTFFTVLSFACFWRGAVQTPRSRLFVAAFLVAFALAMMAKAPLPLAIVGASLFLYWFLALPLLDSLEGLPPSLGHPLHEATGETPVRRGFWEAFRGRLAATFSGGAVLWLTAGGVFFIVLAFAWPVYVSLHVGNALDLWRIEYVDRFAGEMKPKKQPFWYYIPIAFALTAPYMLSLVEAVASPFLRVYRSHRRATAFALTWAVCGTVFLSYPSFKRPHYLLSVAPAYCLLLAPVIERLFFGPFSATSRAGRFVAGRAHLLLPLCLGVGFIIGGFVVHQRYPTMVRTYAMVVPIALVIWTLAAWSFTSGRRLVSFALLNLGMLAVLSLGWPALGRHLDVSSGAERLAAAMRDHGLTAKDEIYMVTGRPNSSIEFYHGFHIRRLIDEIEMADLRGDRTSAPLELYAEFAERIEQQLRKNHPVYLIIEPEHFEMLRRMGKVGCSVLFQPGGDPTQSSEGNLMVITQEARPTSNPSTTAATGPTR
jgi:4-amino-4-deoxy-L-arabinose transferase-like glycosyltransferase